MFILCNCEAICLAEKVVEASAQAMGEMWGLVVLPVLTTFAKVVVLLIFALLIA